MGAEATSGDPFLTRWRGTDLGYADHVRFVPQPLDRETYRRTALAVLDLLDAVECGTGDEAQLAELSRVLGLHAPLRGDRRHIEPAAGRTTLATLERIACNHAPSAGLEGPLAALGPVAEALDPTVPGHRDVLRNAAALWAFEGDDGWGRSPALAWERTRPVPSVADRAGVRAVGLAPLGVYAIEAIDGPAWSVRSIVRIGRWFTPHTLHVPTPGAAFRPPRAGDTLLAKATHTRWGWDAPVALVVPGTVPEALAARWVERASLVLRLWNRRATRDDVLRIRGHAISLRVHEWALARRGSDSPRRDGTA